MNTAVLKLQSESRWGFWLELTKFRISVVSTFTAAMGFVASSRQLTLPLLSTLIGTLLLAMAASALNEVQECKIDALMTRTRHRPLPSGWITARAATLTSLLMAASGALLLTPLTDQGRRCSGCCYGLVQRRLYATQAHDAICCGSRFGDWCVATCYWVGRRGWQLGSTRGSFVVLRVLPVASTTFRLLALRHQGDYTRVGLPTLGSIFSTAQIFRLIFTWTCASVAASVLLMLFQAITGLVGATLVIVAGVWLVWRFSWMLRPNHDSTRLFNAFMDINRYALILMAAVVFDSLVTA